MGYDVFISYNRADRLIAEAACHYIEARRLRCFIAPRDIQKQDWAGNLTQAIESSRAFVVVVSENSIISNEVGKEVTLATRNSNYIFPLRIDNSELNERMTYHLSAFHWIDAVTPPVEKKLIELADRIETSLAGQVENLDLGNLSGSAGRFRQRLLGAAVSPRREFLGREKELQQLHELFTSGTNAVFLTGMGGIGKSEIAKAYANAHANTYPCTVLAGYEKDLLHLIADDQAIPVSNLQQASASGGQGETTADYYQRKMRVLRSIVDSNTLLIIDNFDTEWDEHLSEVLQLPCKLLFTTRTDFSGQGCETLKVGPMENMEDLEQLVSRIYKPHTAEADREAIREIIRLLDCHTYAVSLTAAQMKAGRIPPVKMLEKLRREGLNIGTRSAFAWDMGLKKATAYEYIRALFDFSGLDAVSCDILRYLACLGRDGVDIDLFMECCGIEDFGDISRLADLNWILHDEENERIGLHMLVRELVWERLRPDQKNCRPLLEGAYAWAENAWNKSYKENCSHNAVIFALLDTFREPELELLDWFEEYATFAWIQGRFDLAERCEHALYRLCVDHYGEVSVRAGAQALRVAAVYHNQADYAAARPWYEKGLQVQETIDPESYEAYAARSKVARCDAQNGNFQAALEKFEYNLKIVERRHADLEARGERGEILRKSSISVAFARSYLAHIYHCVGRSAEGLPLAQMAYDYLKTDTVEPSLVVFAMQKLSYVCAGVGDYASALDYVRRGREADIRFHGENNMDCLIMWEVEGDLLSLQGRCPEAAVCYEKALEDRKEYYPAGVKAIAALEQKRDDAARGLSLTKPFWNSWT